MRPQFTGYPVLELHEEKILIIVKTYPRPSAKYRELVCTAGITQNGKWVDKEKKNNNAYSSV